MGEHSSVVTKEQIISIRDQKHHHQYSLSSVTIGNVSENRIESTTNDRREKLEQRIDGRSLRARYSAMSTMLKAKHTDNTEIWHTSLRILFTTNYSSLRTGSKVV